MQALEKTMINTDWATILLVVLFCFVSVLKFLDVKKLKIYTFALFNKGFIETESEEDVSIFNTFHLIIFAFSALILAFVTYTILVDFSENKNEGFYFFTHVTLIVFLYILIKWTLEYLLSLLFMVKNEVHFFLVSKSSYLFNICFYLFICLILVQYTKLNSTFLLVVTVLFFAVRFGYHIINNKNLIINKLFYFILYICALEIAPLFVVFKLMF